MSGQADNGTQMKADKPLEYHIAAATNPYISEEDRADQTEKLCEKIGDDLEGGAVAVRILSHKILSPDQAEALIALNVIDQCVRNCGQKVWNEVSKFRFLNQFVRLLSPKYMGLETSTTVRNRAIELLFTWKNSMRHLGKIEDVYSLLKDQGVILRDPEVNDEMPNYPKPSRMAFFEDEEKAQLLSELLKSKNPEDLQAANRLIKSMVRSEDLRMERVTKRRECIDKAEGSCRVLSEMLDEYSMFSKSDHGVMKEIYDDLLVIRPMLFRYAGEAAENSDDSLADVLTVNDVVNRTIQRYKAVAENGKEAQDTRNAELKSSSKQALTGTDLLGMVDVLKQSSTPNNSVTSFTELEDDTLIGMSLASSPAVPKKKSVQREEKPKSSLDELLGNLVEKAFSLKGPEIGRPGSIALPETKVHELVNNYRDPFSPVDVRELSHPAKNADFSLDSVSLELSDVNLNLAKNPVVIFDSSNVKILLYFGSCSRLPAHVSAYVTAITNTNCYDLVNIRLTLASSSPNIDSRVLATSKDTLPAFSPIAAQQSISQIVMLDTASNVKNQKISMRYAFGYVINETHKNFSGEFTIDF
ncbi:hypothetical protein L596_004183 [Steinernema carpocapsae]|uniref:VHS domain-containing protein n=1 Tax=Steinernema carpocapsae TaxID=34508 RepID=A0A4U8UV41_STECR|nr:hypothetical protein L596_004183 [Steinernema carpocapsae]